jgi:hypothetical protein
MKALTANQTAILNHVQANLLDVEENINADGTLNFNFIEADICMDIAEGKLDAVENFDDIDIVFSAIASVEDLFNDCVEAIKAAREAS